MTDIPLPLCGYAPRPGLLDGKIILVTGASDGIGRAVCIAFAEHGATVIAVDRKSRKLEILYDEIMDRGLPEPALAVHDLSKLDRDKAQQIAFGVAHDFGRLDGLLHNAAELRGLGSLQNYDAQQWVDLLQLNLTAPFLLTQALLAPLRQSPGASVVFTSADVGRVGRAYWGAYAAAYGGIERLAQVLADELETNTRIRVNTLDPGPVRTKMRNLAYPAENPDLLASAESITPAYLFLMCDDSFGVSGRALSAQLERPAAGAAEAR